MEYIGQIGWHIGRGAAEISLSSKLLLQNYLLSAFGILSNDKLLFAQ